jgi:hypothetical protein
VRQGLAAGIHGTTLWKIRVGIKSKKMRAGWRPSARQRLSKKSQVGMDRRAVLLLRRSRPLVSQRRRFAPESWGRSASRPYLGERFALLRGWCVSAFRKILGRDGSPSRPTFAAQPPLSRRDGALRLNPGAARRAAPTFGGRFALPRGWCVSTYRKSQVGMGRRAVLLLRRSRPCLAETALRA